MACLATSKSVFRMTLVRELWAVYGSDVATRRHVVHSRIPVIVPDLHRIMFRYDVTIRRKNVCTCSFQIRSKFITLCHKQLNREENSIISRHIPKTYFQTPPLSPNQDVVDRCFDSSID